MFLPQQFVVPVEWRTMDLWPRVLRPDVTELDFAALMESRERLRLWENSTWPRADFTLKENELDLIEHEREWEEREAFRLEWAFGLVIYGMNDNQQRDREPIEYAGFLCFQADSIDRAPVRRAINDDVSRET